MKKFFLGIMLCMAVGVAAETIKGGVIDAQGNAMPFVTISVLAPDSTLLTGSITDDDGKYEVEVSNPKYIIQASYVGYQTAFGGPDFVLREETERLAELEVKAKKPLIERQMDKLVVNVSNSPFALGSNASDLLKKAPGVNIDKDGKVTVNGKSVEIWIDGRPSNLSGEQLKAMLQGTDGGTIEKIEIISNPSAKYDAAGQGGIINIKTKRNMMKGLNGSLYAGYGGMYYGDVKRYLQQEIASLNLNYRTEKTYTFGTLTQVYSSGSQTIETGSSYKLISETDTTAMRRVSDSDLGIDFQYYMAKIGNDWFIDKKNTLGFILNVPILTMKIQGNDGIGTIDRLVGDTWQTTETVRTATGIKMYTPQHNANLNFTHVFNDSLNRELTVNIDYNRYNTQNRNTQANSITRVGLADSTSGLLINTKQLAQIYSAKLDFQTNFWRTGMIEAGAKWALSSTTNHMTTDSTINGQPIPTKYSDFVYDEHIAALYITAGKQFGQHWNVKLGLRGEYTYSKGEWLTADSTTTRSYFNLFPTAFVGYNPTDKWGLSLSYTRRIDRPSYWNMNPFVSYIDAHSYMEGNPDLKPQFTHSVELQTNYSQYVSLAFNFSQTSNLFAQQTSVMPNGDTRIKWENFGSEMSVGANLSLTELPIVPKYKTLDDGSRTMEGAWLALTLNGGYYYQMKRNDTFAYNHHWGFVSATLTSYLPKDWTLSVDGYYYSPSKDGYDYNSSFYGMNFALKKTIMSKGLILGLQAHDLLRSMHFESHAMNLPEGYSSYSRSISRNQKISLSIVWMFGTQQYMKRRNVGNVDELNRLGGGGGGVKTGS